MRLFLSAPAGQNFCHSRIRSLPPQRKRVTQKSGRRRPQDLHTDRRAAGARLRRATTARFAAGRPRLVYADGARPFPRRPRRMFAKRGMGRHDVTLICLQILCLQCLYYAMLGMWFIGGHIVFGITLHLDRFFDTHTSLDVQSMSAAFELAGVLGAGLGASYLLSVVVEKARKCLDFAVTLYGTHLLLSLCYSRSFPRWTWWLCHGSALVIAVVCGEFLCARNELKEIPLAVVPGERTPKAER